MAKTSAFQGLIFSFVLSCLLFGLSDLAYAEDVSCTPLPEASIDMLQCKLKELKNLDGQVSAIYKTRLKSFTHDEYDVIGRNKINAAQLRTSQSSWLRYREDNCTYLGGVQGGSNTWVGIFSTDCRIDETKRRIKFLKEEARGG